MRRVLPLLLLTACRSTPAPPTTNASPVASSTRVPDPQPVFERPTASGGFVVFVGDVESYVIPVDPAIEAQRYPGLFIGSAEPGAHVQLEITLAAHTEFDIEEYVAVCYEGRRDLSVAAITSGVVHRQDMRSSIDCGGLNNYALESTMQDFRSEGSRSEFAVDQSFVCFGDVGVSMMVETALEDGCRFGDDDCCPMAGEGLAHRIVSGTLIEFGGDVSPVGEECGCIRRTPVSAQTCASPYDPCGTDDAFVGRAGWDAWWVATDGSAGLAVSRAGEFLLYAPGEADPVRIEGLGYSAQDVVGVEFVPAVPAAEHPIVEAVVVDVPVSDEIPTTTWGELCFERFKQGRLDAAEAACIEGLLDNVSTGDDAARGALLYSLGRVEETRGHLARARLLYARSLGLRPGNAAVEKRLSAL